MKFIILTLALITTSFACADYENPIKVNKIMEEFRKNTAHAKKKFLNKELLVRGVCAKVGKMFLEDKYVLELNPMGNVFLPTAINCEFSADEKRSLKNIAKEDEIVIAGTMVSQHRIKDCSIVRVIPGRFHGCVCDEQCVHCERCNCCEIHCRQHEHAHQKAVQQTQARIGLVNKQPDQVPVD
ncbi:hypothetical protein FACS189449_01190 [Alphaproteobacteria bacterium]|nr:hypothetical protein FACS189449_01190 [Alphaproteobacteria bacterium]